MSSVAVRRSIVRCTKVRSRSVRELMDTISTGVWDDLGVVSLDRFGYCEGAPIDFDGLEQLVDDPDVWTGTNIYDLYSMAAAIPAAAVVHDRPRFDGAASKRSSERRVARMFRSSSAMIALWSGVDSLEMCMITSTRRGHSNLRRCGPIGRGRCSSTSVLGSTSSLH